MGCDQSNNNIDCALFSIANATVLAFKGGPRKGCFRDRRCFPVHGILDFYLYTQHHLS